MEAAISAATVAGTSALVSVLVVFFAIAVSAGREARETGNEVSRRWLAVGVFCAFGIIGAIAATFAYSTNVVGPLAIFTAMAVFGVFLAAFVEGIRKPQAFRRLIGSGRRWRLVVPLALAIVLIGIGAAMGSVFRGGAEKRIVVTAGPYRVYGTCDDGSCTVNECRMPAECGLDNVGRLPEGQRLDIECQERGRRAVAPHHRVSYVWDRLGNGDYVSDLFIDTPGKGQLTGPRSSVHPV